MTTATILDYTGEYSGIGTDLTRYITVCHIRGDGVEIDYLGLGDG